MKKSERGRERKRRQSLPICQSIGQLKMHTITCAGSKAEAFTYAYVRVLPGCWNEGRKHKLEEGVMEGTGRDAEKQRGINL